MSVVDVEAPVRKRNYRTFSVRALLVFTALVAVLVALWMTYQPERQVVSALIQVKNAPPGSLISRPVMDPVEVRAFRDTQVELLRSAHVLRGALQKQGIAQLSIVRKESNPVAWLQANLQIDYPNDSEILRVRLGSWHPDEAAKVVNAVVDAYFDICVYQEISQRKRYRDQLQQAYVELKQRAGKRRSELLQLAAATANVKAADHATVKDGELAGLEALVQQAFMRLEEAKLEADAPQRVQQLDRATPLK